jgi:hypothetical protein
MKKQLFALLGLGVLLATASAYAQTINVKADVPFSFVVTTRTLPSGEYTLRSIEGINHAVAITGESQKPSIFLVNPSGRQNSMAASLKGKLVFTRYGDRYFLSEIWMAGSHVGQKLLKSPREVEIARSETAEQVVILAELR